MAFIVIYDACVLYPAPLRDLLIRIARTGVVRAHWSDVILDEAFDNLHKDRPDLDSTRLLRTRELMNKALHEPLVTGFEDLMESLTLPDPNDRHVLAAAIRAGAQVIVTWNVKDFPARSLAPFDIEVKTPDEFVLDALDLAPARICGVVQAQADALKNPPHTINDMLEKLQQQHLIRSVARIREILAPQ